MLSKYTLEERLNIGREIYDGKYTTRQASKNYNISFYTARDYLRAYTTQYMGGIPKNSSNSSSRQLFLKIAFDDRKESIKNIEKILLTIKKNL